jgi:hypothetical protein
MYVGEYRRRACLCGQAACICAGLVKRLDREGLGELERYASDGTVLLSSRGGAPKPPSATVRRAVSPAELERRRSVLATADFGSSRSWKRASARRRRRAIYSRYASGEQVTSIAKRFGVSHPAVLYVIRTVERRTPAREQLSSIARDCDPELVLLFWALLRRALEQPDEVRKALDEAERTGAVRQLVHEETQDG